METTLPLPKYHQIYLVLREQLQEGRFDTEGVPGEHLLADQFAVARITIRKAMEMLVADGLVTRRPGVGTWPVRAETGKKQGGPNAKPVSREKAHLTGLLENIVNMGLRTTVEVIDSTVVLASEAVSMVAFSRKNARVKSKSPRRSYSSSTCRMCKMSVNK